MTKGLSSNKLKVKMIGEMVVLVKSRIVGEE